MKLFYELLQISLGTRKAFTKLPSEDEWLFIFNESERQSLASFMFTGVEMTVKHYGGLANIGIDLDLFATWYSYTQKIEEKGNAILRKSIWLQDWLSKQQINSCILKGQGNALLYPIPSRRMFGDIDVWVWFKSIGEKPVVGKYEGKNNRLQFIKWVQKRMKGKYAEIGIHHIHLEPLDKVEVEGHYWPSYFFNFSTMRKFEHWCEEEHLRQMSNWKELPDGIGRISVPTVEFNLIYQLVHIMRHFFHDGLGLRQMVDYYWLLLSGKINYSEVQILLNKFKLNNIMGGVLWIMKEVFLMDTSNIPFKIKENVGLLMLKEMERGGNFGRDDRDIAKWRYNSKPHIFVWRTWRNIKFMSISPSEVLWSVPFRVWQFFWIRKMEAMANIYKK